MKEFEFTEYEEVIKHFQQGFHGTDKKGRPMLFDRVGMCNFTELMKVTTEERLSIHLMC